MKVSYRGIQKDLSPQLQEKLDAKFSKLSKMLERTGEKEAHVVVTTERHLHNAEITMQFYDHPLIGIGSDADLFTALQTALDKVEKQAVKQRTKWREKHRRPEISEPFMEVVTAADGEDGEVAHRVFRVRHHEHEKPITLEEALLQMEKDRDYVVYRDADKECLSVLVRRRDGHFDLIES